MRKVLLFTLVVASVASIAGQQTPPPSQRPDSPTPAKTVVVMPPDSIRPVEVTPKIVQGPVVLAPAPPAVETAGFVIAQQGQQQGQGQQGQQGQQGRQGQQGQQQGQQGQGQQGRAGQSTTLPLVPFVVPMTGPIVPVPSSGYGQQNLSLQLTITDSLSSTTQNKKTVTMLIADGRSGQVRSAGRGDSVINVDARPSILRGDGRIYLQLTVEYRPELTPEQSKEINFASQAMLSESLTMIIPDGKPVIVSQAADPRGDRKVAVEVTATIVK